MQLTKILAEFVFISSWSLNRFKLLSSSLRACNKEWESSFNQKIHKRITHETKWQRYTENQMHKNNDEKRSQQILKTISNVCDWFRGCLIFFFLFVVIQSKSIYHRMWDVNAHPTKVQCIGIISSENGEPCQSNMTIINRQTMRQQKQIEFYKLNAGCEVTVPTKYMSKMFNRQSINTKGGIFRSKTCKTNTSKQQRKNCHFLSVLFGIVAFWVAHSFDGHISVNSSNFWFIRNMIGFTLQILLIIHIT